MTHVHEDNLIGRIAANEADGAEWKALEQHASSHPGASERLARALRDELQVRGALAEALDAADGVELPEHVPAESLRLAFGHHGVSMWGGWAMAAMVALAWFGLSFFAPDRPGLSPAAGGGPSITQADLSADDALRQYVERGAREGRVLQELPMIMVEMRQDDGSGRMDVVYIRPLLERAPIESAYELRRDELGRPAPGRIDLATFQNRSKESDT